MKFEITGRQSRPARVAQKTWTRGRIHRCPLHWLGILHISFEKLAQGRVQSGTVIAYSRYFTVLSLAKSLRDVNK